jgi:glutathione S-transferase
VKLYNVAYSGNSYKIRLLLAHLGLACEIVEVDILKGESRTPEFLKINPNGRTPVLKDNGFIHAESNAILAYLARGTRLLPDDRQRWALVFQWLFFEQYSHEPCIATSRFWLQHKPDTSERAAVLAARREGGWAALQVMEKHLSKTDFFVGGYTIADIALLCLHSCLTSRRFPTSRSAEDSRLDRARENTARLHTNELNAGRTARQITTDTHNPTIQR